jgi:Flp pilus assembly protein TadD
MRILSFIFILGFGITVSAQDTPLVKRAFADGTKLAQNAQYEPALENYRRAIVFSESEKIEKDFLARIHFNAGVCLFHLRRNNEAIAEFDQAINLSGGAYQKAFYALGMAQTKLKNWQKAEAAFRDAVSLKRTDAEAWFDLGMVLIERKNFAAARSAFENALKYKSVAATDARNNIGVILALAGDLAAAEKEFETALAEAKGESAITLRARNNLRFCRLYKQAKLTSTPAKFEFSRMDEEGE